MKKLGVEWIIGVSAVGSLQKEIERSNLVLVDQFIDKTVKRETTFFGNGIVGHAGFGDPCCSTLRKYLAEACSEKGVVFKDKGTYVNMEGPQFSTRAGMVSFSSPLLPFSCPTLSFLARPADIIGSRVVHSVGAIRLNCNLMILLVVRARSLCIRDTPFYHRTTT